MLRYFIFFLILLSKLHSQSVLNCELLYKIHNSNDNELLDVIIDLNSHQKIDFSSYPEVKLKYQEGTLYSINGTIKSIKEISKLKAVKRIEYTKHNIKLMADTCMYRNRIIAIKQGLPPLPQSYDGNGVVIGIIDSGTDFNHPDLKDIYGKTRIKYLWDMTKTNAANTPTAFGYGQEWNNNQIDQGMCTHSDVAHYGHGTNSAGIASGNGLAINKYEGVAPKADIVVVALDFNRPGFIIADAVKYIVEKANQLGKPLVINASVGDYYGSHDGTDLETQIIDSLIGNKPGKVLVGAAGNAGSVKYHVGYNVNLTDTNFTWISNNSNRIYVSEYSDTSQIKQVQYNIGVNNNALHNLGSIGFKPYNYALNTIKRDTIYKNNQRIGIVESIASINSFGTYELFLSIKADSVGYKWRIEHTGNGRIDSWNFDYVTSNLPSSNTYPKIINYKSADTTQTIVSGFQCSNEVITVANYVNRNQYVDVNNNVQITTETPGNIAGSSSVGPTRDGKTKPDIASSGATILTCTAINILPSLITNAPYMVAQGGYHVTAGGTSAASPVVAGLAALYLQKNPTATNRDVKQAITNCAYNDNYTTSNLPNYRWGYGKLDGFAAMMCGVPQNTVSVKEYDSTNILAIPNPMIDKTELHFSDNSFKTIQIFDSRAELVSKNECSCNQYVINKNDLASGIYMVSVQEKTKTYRIKLLVL